MSGHMRPINDAVLAAAVFAECAGRRYRIVREHGHVMRYERADPKVRGKAARKAEKRARREARR